MYTVDKNNIGAPKMRIRFATIKVDILECLYSKQFS